MNLKFEKTAKSEGIQCLDSKSQFIEVPINLNTGCYIVKCIGADFVKFFKLIIK